MTKIPKTNFTFDLKHFLKKRSHVKTCVPSLKKYKTTKTKFWLINLTRKRWLIWKEVPNDNIRERHLLTLFLGGLWAIYGVFNNCMVLFREMIGFHLVGLYFHYLIGLQVTEGWLPEVHRFKVPYALLYADFDLYCLTSRIGIL